MNFKRGRCWMLNGFPRKTCVLIKLRGKISTTSLSAQCTVNDDKETFMNSWKLKRKEVICINFHTICRKSTLLFDDENSPKYEKFAFKWTTRKYLIASHSLRTIFPALYAKTTSLCHYPPLSVRKRPHITSDCLLIETSLRSHWDLRDPWIQALWWS